MRPDRRCHLVGISSDRPLRPIIGLARWPLVWVGKPARLLAGLGVLLAFSGCAASKVYLSPNYTSLGKVAVLPMANETNDLDGPIFIRNLIQNQLAMRGVQMIPPATVDAQLKAQGFTDGGQLHATTPQK